MLLRDRPDCAPAQVPVRQQRGTKTLDRCLYVLGLTSWLRRIRCGSS